MTIFVYFDLNLFKLLFMTYLRKIFSLIIIILFTKSSFSQNRIFYVSNNGNDSNNGTISSPIAKIQTAINLANNGDTVILARGIYNETIDLQGKIAFLSSQYYISKDTSDITNTICKSSV